MSNLVSLYVSPANEFLNRLRNIDWDAEDPFPDLHDYLDKYDSDMFSYHLSELYHKRASQLTQPLDEFLKIILWSWIEGGIQICDVEKQIADEHGLDLAIGPQGISDIAHLIVDASPDAAASALYTDNECWDSPEELANYLACWISAFKKALESHNGLFYKIWI